MKKRTLQYYLPKKRKKSFSQTSGSQRKISLQLFAGSAAILDFLGQGGEGQEDFFISCSYKTKHIEIIYSRLSLNGDTYID